MTNAASALDNECAVGILEKRTDLFASAKKYNISITPVHFAIHCST